jgi:hypothetical protein
MSVRLAPGTIEEAAVHTETGEEAAAGLVVAEAEEAEEEEDAAEDTRRGNRHHYLRSIIFSKTARKAALQHQWKLGLIQIPRLAPYGYFNELEPEVQLYFAC